MLRKVVTGAYSLNSTFIRRILHSYSHSNSPDFDEPFTQPRHTSSTAQLNRYEQYLIKHNVSLKKPHQKLRTQEERIIQQCLNQQQYAQILSFLFNNSNRRLCSTSTALNVDQRLAANYQTLDLETRKKAAFCLVSFRELKVFNLFKKQVERQLIEGQISNIEVESLFVYLYGQIINYKNLDFICLLLAKKQKNYSQAIELVYQTLFYHKYRGIYQNQFNNLLTYLQLVLNPALNKIQPKRSQDKERSHLQSLVQSFLRVLGYENVRECTINNYKVDFLIQKQWQGHTKRIGLEVNGNYHYTLGGKLKGKEILRNLIINQGVPLRIVHQQDFLLSKGNRNKMAYIQHLLGLKEVNWESKNEGIDSGWQVSQVENLVQYPSK